MVPLRAATQPATSHEAVVEARGHEALAPVASPEPLAPSFDRGVERTGTHPRTRRAELVHLPEPESPPSRAERPGPAVQSAPEPQPRAHRPPVLASQSLHEELFPAEPGRRVARGIAGVMGLLGAPAMLALPSPAPALAWWNALMLLGAAMAALLSVGYARRAAWLLLTAIGGLSANTAWLLTPQAPPDALGLGLGLWLAPLTMAGLSLRAMHRASRTARLLVLLGGVPLFVWLLLSGALASRSLRSLLDGLRYGTNLALAAMTASGSLAFMSPSTKAAADWIAIGLWGAYTAHLAVGAASGELPIVFAVAVPLFTALGALGLSGRLAWRERLEADRHTQSPGASSPR